MSETTNLLRTPLADVHQELGAKMVEFGGWLMPVHYTSILQEHKAIRSTAGLFDISHMGELVVKGTGSEAWVNSLFCNDIRKISPGWGQYTLLLNESGGTVDDLIIYRLADQEFLLVVNASQIEKDFKWLERRLGPNVTIENQSEEFAAIALQGPKSEGVFRKLFDSEKRPLKRNQFIETPYKGKSVLVARTGYTGEDGFEIFLSPELATPLWKDLLKHGELVSCVSAGLGCRDTLRLEACYPLYGHELSQSISPLEAGLDHFVSFDKPEKFVGNEPLREQKESGITRSVAAFEITGPGAPPRAQYPVFAKNNQIGEVTSGSHSPTLNKGIGLALIARDFAKPGTEIEIEVRGKRQPARVVKKPFYSNL
ncbi:MAG: glycine cleavage system aminomethyltransferase GcvT [Methylacidiphilales bacterium]|nr:glycine cleavage system aminomethyltransferase GcvT [Candidatus Methylacidiphilales bacterium]